MSLRLTTYTVGEVAEFLQNYDCDENEQSWNMQQVWMMKVIRTVQKVIALLNCNLSHLEDRTDEADGDMVRTPGGVVALGVAEQQQIRQ